MRTISKSIKAILLLAVVAGIGLGSIAAAGATTEHYTDGTQNEAANDWGPPPEAPFLDTEAGQICIDPPSQLWMTLHVVTDGTETDSLVFEYTATEQGFVCTDYTAPVCPVEEIEIYGTWNIGLGRSPSLFIDNDCPDPQGELTFVQPCDTGTDVTLTNTGEAAWTVNDGGPFDGQVIEPGATSTVNMGSEAGSLTVSFSAGPKSGEASAEWVAVAPCPIPEPPKAEPVPPAAATPVATPPVATGEALPVTGPMKIGGMSALGALLLAIGFVMNRANKAKRGLNV